MGPKQLLDHFFTRFKERHGAPMLVNGGRDMRLMKNVWAAYGEASFALIDEFFERPSEWVETHGFTIPIFYSECNNMVSRKKRGDFYGGIIASTSNENPALSARSGKEHHLTVVSGGDGGPVPSAVRKTGEVV